MKNVWALGKGPRGKRVKREAIQGFFQFCRTDIFSNSWPGSWKPGTMGVTLSMVKAVRSARRRDFWHNSSQPISGYRNIDFWGVSGVTRVTRTRGPEQGVVPANSVFQLFLC